MAGMFGNPGQPLPKATVAELLKALPIREAPQAQGILPGDQPSLPQMPSLPGMPAKRGPFGLGATGAAALGGLFDSILTQTGGQAVHIPNMLHQKELERRQALAQQQRTTDFEDWRRRYDYQVENAKPVNNDTVADYEFWKSVLSPEDFQRWLTNTKIDPPRLQLLPNGSLAQVGGYNPASAPTAPVGKLTPIGGR